MRIYALAYPPLCQEQMNFVVFAMAWGGHKELVLAP